MSKINKLLFAFVFLLFLSSCFRYNSSTDKDIFRESNEVFNFKQVDDLYQFLTYSEQRVPLISAHRGGSDKNFPENAIESFQRVSSFTPAIIECDIALTKDSVLVLMHDETLDRTTTGHGKLDQYTWSELKELKLKDSENKVTPYHIPTLEEALNWGIGRVIFTLDVKRKVPYQLVIDAIRKANAEAYVVVITYTAAQAALVHNLAPDLMISASIKTTKDLTRLMDLNIPDTRLVAFIGTTQVDKALTDLLHQHGILCILGTIGNLDRRAQQRGSQIYADFIENGADILSTDRPMEAAKVLHYYIKQRSLSSTYIN